ncbi:MAG TPA: Hsp20/alpha crystallin family protein [Deltaproteobacteria bacterium]|nr:Hsp20/alpha crystallin family protein [Deltaproteobacteria bacterium]
MALPTRSLRGDLLFLKERMNRAFEESVHDSGLVSATLRWVPCVDIYEDDASLVIKVELPGVKREDISLDITDYVLSISGVKPSSHVEGAETFHVVERQYGHFRRTFNLPEDIDLERVEASYNAGVLEVVMPRTRARQSRRIPIMGECA